MGLTTFAQIESGFYRVKNKVTGRYLMAVDDKSTGVNTMAQTADVRALISLRGFDKVVSDAASVVYIENRGNNQYNLNGQGLDLYNGMATYVDIVPNGDAYQASGSRYGFTIYLCDYGNSGGAAQAYPVTNNQDTRDWYVYPVNQDADKYFGLAPEIQLGDDDYFTTLYVSFPFTFASSGMEAWKVIKVDNELNAVVYEKIEGVVPGKTPVIIRCSSAASANNKLSIEANSAPVLADNNLKGVYFCFYRTAIANTHTNLTAYNPSTMRVLGKLSDGSIGFVKATTLPYPAYNNNRPSDDTNIYLPPNRAYLPVASNAGDEMKLMTKEEYEVLASIEEIGMDAIKSAPVYTLTGVKVREKGESIENLPVGVYVTNGKKFVVK